MLVNLHALVLAEKKRLSRQSGATIPFAGREVDELNPVVGETHDLLEVLAAPQRDAALVERREVRALGRPADVRLRPHLKHGAPTASLTRASQVGDGRLKFKIGTTSLTPASQELKTNIQKISHVY